MNAIRHSNPQRKDGVTLRRAGSENILYDPVDERVHMVNDTAVAIWNLCDGDTDPDEMVGAIVQLSGLPEAIVEEDVARLLREFDEAGLIVWTS